MEALVIDACLMSSIETAWSVREYARWMIASEKNVPGKGSAVENWLQYLLEYPECDGEWLGRCICDTTGIKYANGAEEEAKSILTWSVTDLSKIEPLTESIEKFFSICGKALKERPEIANFYMNCIFAAPEYGDGVNITSPDISSWESKNWTVLRRNGDNDRETSERSLTSARKADGFQARSADASFVHIDDKVPFRYNQNIHSVPDPPFMIQDERSEG